MKLSMLPLIAVTQMAVGYALSYGMELQADRAHNMGPPEIAKLCSADGALDVDQFHQLRDYIRYGTILREQLLPIGDALSGATRKCSVSTFVDAEVIASLYGNLGDRLLKEKEYSRAKQSFAAADELSARFGFPSLTRLGALQGEAQAELMLGNLAGADALASSQTDLARAWVDKQHFTSGALVYALRFEAKICNAENQVDRARQLIEEAERIQSTNGNDQGTGWYINNQDRTGAVMGVIEPNRGAIAQAARHDEPCSVASRSISGLS